MITSSNNPKIKQLRLLMEKSRLRRETGLFVVEGVRELEIALKSGFAIKELYMCPDIFRDKEKEPWFREKTRMAEEIDSVLYGKLAYRGTTEGVLAVMYAKDIKPANVRLQDPALVIVLESVEKPGNLGAILRTADASGTGAVLICDPLTDLYNPNTIRASLGCVFSVPTLPSSSEEAYQWLTGRGIQVVAATCQATAWYNECDYTKPTALVLGSESNGLSPFWREKANHQIKIPMKGIIDSLNVSSATAILCFEALRQRNQ